MFQNVVYYCYKFSHGVYLLFLSLILLFLTLRICNAYSKYIHKI